MLASINSLVELANPLPTTCEPLAYTMGMNKRDIQFVHERFVYVMKNCYLCIMLENKDFTQDEIYGKRLLISIRADQTELNDNIRVARVLLSCFDDMFIIINEHLLTIGHKNPEYTINGKLGDRKGVESENGIKSAFRKAKQQGCKVVVLDFDMHMSESILKTKKIVSGLFGRHEDFSQGTLEECYVVHNSKAVVVKSDAFAAPDKETIKQLINDVIERLRT